MTFPNRLKIPGWTGVAAQPSNHKASQASKASRAWCLDFASPVFSCEAIPRVEVPQENRALWESIQEMFEFEALQSI